MQIECKKGPAYVLGTGLSHDGSACLLRNGEICVAIEKERVTRVKHDGFNDTPAITYCLDAAGIGIADLSLIVQNANFGMFEQGNLWFRGPRVIGSQVPVVTISHHLAHAYSAIGTSPFEESAILVIDGCGSGFDECVDLDSVIVPEQPLVDLKHLYFEKDSYYEFRENKMRPVYKDFSPWGMAHKEHLMYPNTTLHSIGGVYLAVSMYIFNGFEDPGKLMGLAPYGRPGIHDFQIFDLRDGRAFVRYDWIKAFRRPARTVEQFRARFQEYADLAYWVQKELERAVLYIANSRYQLRPNRNLCYAGGVALNAVANTRLIKGSSFSNVYIQPAAGDNGLSVGCAYYGWLQVLKRERVFHGGSTTFGATYTDDAVKAALNDHVDELIVSTPDDYIKEAAELLAQGHIVAWFQDGAEFGPRALGNRSILADPRSAGIGQFINRRVKCREDFRPFAPAVPAEDAKVYFEAPFESPYMLLVTRVKPDWRTAIPAVVHRDGSARVQTVAQKDNPKFYRLLKEFQKLTGISVLLNTSLNKRRMPIVETPRQAVDLYLDSGMTVLVLKQYLVRKRRHQAPWLVWRSEEENAIGLDVSG